MTWRIDPNARATLFSLRDDPTQARLFRKLRSLVVVIVTEPGSRTSRRRAYQGGGWRVDVPGEDWMILWDVEDGEVVIRYIGPAL